VVGEQHENMGQAAGGAAGPAGGGVGVDLDLFRTGAPDGRGIYGVQREGFVYFGQFDSPKIAEFAAQAMNRALLGDPMQFLRVTGYVT
jgi:hypothetical protein